MIDFRPLLQPSFWFDLTPVSMTPFFERALFVVFALFVIAGAALRIVARGKREKYERIAYHRAASAAMTLGVVGFLIYFLTFEEVQFFGARFWFLLWFIALIVVVVRLVRFVRKEVPALRHRDQSRAEANKYLPRRN